MEAVGSPWWYVRKPIPVDPAVRAEFAAGFFIHQVVLAVRRTLATEGVTQRELADRLGVKTETVGRKLRGETWVSLAEVVALALELGVDVLPAPSGREELLPPG